MIFEKENRSALGYFFSPASLAVVGATDRERSMDRTVVRNLLEGSYKGRVYPVNPGRAGDLLLERIPTVWKTTSCSRARKNLEEHGDMGQKCVMKVGIKFPAVIDTFDEATERAYTGWPHRLYVMDQDGRVSYKSGPGPFGFHPQGVAEALRRLVPGKKH